MAGGRRGSTCVQLPGGPRHPARQAVPGQCWAAGQVRPDAIEAGPGGLVNPQYLRRARSLVQDPRGRSADPRGQVHTYSFTRVEITPRVGQAIAVSAAIATSTSSAAALRSPTVTASPSRLNSSVASPARTGAGRILIQVRSPGCLDCVGTTMITSGYGRSASDTPHLGRQQLSCSSI